MFDRFKFNRKTAANTIECPLCQEKNPEGSEVCSRCSYQLTLASHQQAGNVNEEETSELFDELLSDFEEDEEEEVVDWSRTTFTMDDVTIDVKQYGKDDSVVTKQKPSFAMTVDTPEPIAEEAEEEEYELTPDDAPEFVTKFEVPDVEEEKLEEITVQQVDLVQPTSESPDDVETVPAEQIPDQLPTEVIQEIEQEEPELPLEEPEPLQEDIEESENLPAPPTNLPPHKGPEIAPPVVDEDQDPMPLPPPPDLSMIDSIPIAEEKAPNFWPWAQQEEWSGRDVAQKVKSAMEAAKSKNIAQATVILDEVGPHLGDRTKLVYPIGALLQRMGRPQAVDRLLEAAMRAHPEDESVLSAKSKLRP
ncbi:MAG: hypothetical protein VXW80_02830 [Candidatus Thermoplasmatota archaeon]|nr:hypothetical protein [Candidatus Thermoplasmatota archaeon]